MFTSNQYRREAQKFRQRAQEATKSAEVAEFTALEHSFDTLADNAEWLAGKSDLLVPEVEDENITARLSAREEHLLQCLGAALIMHWDELPTKLQRELFEALGAISDGLATPVVRDQVAGFFREPDEEAPAKGRASESVDAAGPTRSRDIYRSPNGDVWLLMHELASGHAWVRHVANAPSGGRVTDVEITAFLRQCGPGPEKQELLRMLGTLTAPL